MEEDLRTRGLTDADAARVNDAFRNLGPTLHRWPTAPMVVSALPAVKAALKIDKKKSDEEWKRCQQRSAELLVMTKRIAAQKGAKR